ncbi:Fe2+-dependent dioxygenase [Marinobacter caseinilyticus]|uniref:Fe2+-dependent dioxygenase n=1 Tax=Marinobacter caseinilyticus TaxID=2692195 RepID=UPI00140DCF7C|nr:Fe2+-dependent dioxygenase [Marinobacter caseinilyticus]
MILCIADVIPVAMVGQLRTALAGLPFHDGRETAGWHARTVKNNSQADSRHPEVEALRTDVGALLQQHPLFQMAVRPKRIKPLMFSRYSQGMNYGNHVDDAVMSSPDGPMRTDISYTLFLSNPENYEGGELIIDETAGEREFKLSAGSMVIYPSSTLHRVEPVTKGERLAAVGWSQSLVRSPDQRQVLFDLDTTRRRMFEGKGKTEDFDAISKSYSNLLRMWADL